MQVGNVFAPRRQGPHMIPGEGEQGQTTRQSLGEVHPAGHGLVRQFRHPRTPFRRVGRPRQREFGQGVQGLEVHQGGIEVEDQGGRAGHRSSLSDLRSRSKSQRPHGIWESVAGDPCISDR